MKPLGKARSKTDEPFDYLQKVIIIGDSGVGKSNLLLRYSEGKFVDNYMMTIGINYVFKVISLDGDRIKLQIWDTAGQRTNTKRSPKTTTATAKERSSCIRSTRGSPSTQWLPMPIFRELDRRPLPNVHSQHAGAHRRQQERPRLETTGQLWIGLRASKEQ